jgi:uroporphyrin-III C-methyltransferase/precorrin-2 dehydrogenase/sirohydrochlorin ferrochelatase
MKLRLIEQGTLPGQRVLTGTLSSLAAQAVMAEMKSPSLVIVGGVVNLHNKLKWFI